MRVHTNLILEGLMEMIQTSLKAPLSLQGVYRGNIAWLPPTTLTTLVNGVWLNLEKPVSIEEVTMPKGILFSYTVRFVYVSKINLAENPLDQKIEDINCLVEFLYNNIKPIFPMSGGQVLWMLPRLIEYEPAEDSYVASLSSDLMAVAAEAEIKVRTRI